MFKFNIHSIVDVITNSSTVIYTFQNSIEQTKELVQEIINLMGEKDLTPDDIFYYGVFADYDYIVDRLLDDIHDNIENSEYKNEVEFLKELEKSDYKNREILYNNFLESILKGKRKKPDWLSDMEISDDSYGPSLDLYLLPKDEKYVHLAEKILKLLNSVRADGGREG